MTETEQYIIDGPVNPDDGELFPGEGGESTAVVNPQGQTRLSFDCGAGRAAINLYTGNMLFYHPGMTIGAGSFEININHVYNSTVKEFSYDISGGKKIKTGLGNGWKLSLQQYLFPYQASYGLESYAYAGFDTGDYVYIDGDGLLHRFIYYKTQGGKQIYYDQNGSGLRLAVGDEREITDQNKNLLKFNENGLLEKICSGLNQTKIIKTLRYNSNNQLISIADDRKDSRRIIFNYDKNGLTKMSCGSKYLKYHYNNGNIVQVSKSAKEQNKTYSKDVACFCYDNTNRLIYMADVESKSALKLEYEISKNRMAKISTFAAKLTQNTGYVHGTYCGNETFCSDETFCIDSFRVPGYTVEMPASNLKTSTTFSYNNIVSTTIENEKGLKFVYFFNNNGFTTSILEDVGNQDYRTLTKTSGWMLWNTEPISSTVKLNNKLVQDLSGHAVTVDYRAVGNFKTIFQKKSDNSDSDYLYVSQFVVSFWVRFFGSSGVSAKFSAGYLAGATRDISSCSLDKAPVGSWQYVTMPIDFSDAKNIQDMILSFEGCADFSRIQLADLRIAPGNTAKTIIADAGFDTASLLGYTVHTDAVREYPISHSYFMTESDLFLTHKSMRESSVNGILDEQKGFDLVLCGGTKVVLVKKAWHKDVSGSKHNFGFDYLAQSNTYIPKYYTQSRNRLASSKWCVTETQMAFQFDTAKQQYYYEQKNSVDMLGNINHRPNMDTSSHSFAWTNSDGTFRAQKDAYGTTTENFYDSYGNIERTEVFKTGETEKIVKRFSYDKAPEQRETPVEITENGITRKFSYSDLSKQLTSSQVLGGTPGREQTGFAYNVYEDNMMSVSEGTLSNTLTYDQDGRLKSVIDQTGRTFSFKYNALGEVNEYYAGSTLLLSKTIQRTSDTDIITEQRYVAETGGPYTTKIIVDKYGKPQTNTAGGETTTFTYQDEGNPYTASDPHYAAFDFCESSSVAKITKIEDPYEQTIYNYYYDEENRPCGYAVANSVGEALFSVTQTGHGTTKYEKGAESRTSTIVYEDTAANSGEDKIYIQPRVHKTTDQYDEFDNTYSYDHLGRLLEAKQTKVGYDTKSDVIKTVALKYKNGTVLLEEKKHNTWTGYDASEDRYYYSNSCDMVQGYTYYPNGNIKTFTESGTAYDVLPKKAEVDNPAISLDKTTEYFYDSNNRLKQETITLENSIEKLVYNYDSQGKIVSVERNDAAYRSFKYDSEGRKKSYTDSSGVPHGITYDRYGNVSLHKGIYVTWSSRNLMSHYNTTKFFYNHQNVRYRKETQQGWTKKYYLDGSKILGEQWTKSGSASEKLEYFYDIEGVAGIRYNNKNYNFIRDGLGNISKIMYCNKLLAEYNYDAWGYCPSPKTYGTLSIDERFVVANNPFRWKSYYFDTETDLYYINGRYYDPTIMQCLNADDIENVLSNAMVINGLDRNAIVVDNIVNLIANIENIFPTTELFTDPFYTPNLSWWERNWKKIYWLFFAVTLITSLVLMCIPGTQAFGVGMFVAGLKASISGFAIGGLIGGIVSARQGNSFFEGACQGAIYGAISGFAAGAIMYCASRAIDALIKVCNRAKTSSNILERANFSQTTYRETFSKSGRQFFMDTFGQKINTIDDLTAAINSGTIPASKLPVGYIIRDGNALVMNTRTAVALTRAGISRSLWSGVNQTGVSFFEGILTERLIANSLTTVGTGFVIPV